jgi:Rod binding domain-containing protein
MGDLHSISNNGATQPQKSLDDRNRQRLQRATKEFESVLVGYMLKSMRSSMKANELFGESYGGDVLESMFDAEIANHVSRNSSLGLAEMLYRTMTGEDMPVLQAQSRSTAVTAAIHTHASAAPTSQSPSQASSAKASAAKTSSSPRPAVVLSSADAASLNGPSQASTHALPDTLRRRLEDVAPFIQEAADTHGVDRNLLKAVIATESHGDSLARSPRNAKGLMQLIDSTAAAMGVKNVWDPRDNVMGGARYLSQLMAKFNGDQQKVVASYNAGPGAVVKHGGVPPFRETREYVEKVMNYLRVFEQEE